MPTYDYECQNCGHRFEKFQPITSEPVSECPQCNGKLKRLIGSGAGIIFKGSGFYCTDYKNKTEKKSESPKPAPAKPCDTCCEAKQSGNCPKE